MKVLSLAALIGAVLLGGTGVSASLKPEKFYVAAGPVFEYNFYGQPGVSAEVAYKQFLGGHPQIKVQYTTSKLSFWNGANALNVNDLYGNVSWYFRPEKLVNPYAGIDVGTTWFYRDEKIYGLLDNTAMRLNIRGGVRFAVWGGRILPYIDGGYAVFQSSTTYPLFFSCGLGYAILNGGR